MLKLIRSCPLAFGTQVHQLLGNLNHVLRTLQFVVGLLHLNRDSIFRMFEVLFGLVDLRAASLTSVKIHMRTYERFTSP